MALRLQAEIGMDGSGFAAGMRNAENVVNRFGSQVLGTLRAQIASAFTVGAVVSVTRRTLEYAGTLNDMASRLGVSTDFLQEFRFVAQQTGTDLQTLAGVIERINSVRDIALGGGPAGESAMAAFGAFGVTKSDLQNLRIEDIISGKIADAFAKGDPQGKLGAAFRELGGKSASKLIAGFVDGFNEGRAQAHKAGKVWTEDVIQQLDELGDSFAILGDTILLEWGSVILKLVEWVRLAGSKIEKAINYVVGGTSEWGWQDWLMRLMNPVSSKVGGPFASKPFDTKTAEAAADEVDKEFQAKLDAEMKARQKARENRAKNREPNTAEPVEVKTEKDKKDKKGPELYTDSLLKVGNFLGQGTTSADRIVSVSQVTNQILKGIDSKLGTMQYLKNIDAKFDKLFLANNDISFPI